MTKKKTPARMKTRARAARARLSPRESNDRLAARPPLPGYPTPDEQRRAVGALLTCYRRVRRKDRADLAKAADISKPLLSRIEGGQRLPSREVLDRLCEGLDLTPFERFQVHAIAGYAPEFSGARGMSPLAGDVVRGAPLFLRTLEDDADLGKESGAPEFWILTQRPRIRDGQYFEMLKVNLIEKKARYVWFVDRERGAADIRAVEDRLRSDTQIRESGVKWWDLIKFILCPPTLSIAAHALAIYNPRAEGNTPMYGRAIHVSGGLAVGLYGLDTGFVTQLAAFLTDIYLGCTAPGQGGIYPQDPEEAKRLGTFELRSLNPPAAERKNSPQAGLS